MGFGSFVVPYLAKLGYYLIFRFDYNGSKNETTFFSLK